MARLLLSLARLVRHREGLSARQFCCCGALALACLAAFATNADAKPPMAYTLKRSAPEVRILRALEEQTALDFVEAPLSDVLQYLEDLHKVQFELDNKALEDSAVSSDTPINRNLSNLSLASALHLMLADLDLDFLITNDVLLITSKEVAHVATEIRIYSVKDLLAEDRSVTALSEMVEKMYSNYENHSIVVSPVGDTLVIRDTQRGHCEIEQLLDTLRLALAGEEQPAPQARSAPPGQAPRAVADTPTSPGAPGETPAKADADPFQQP